MATYNYTINGKEYAVNIIAIQGTQATVNVNGVDYTVQLPSAAPAAVATPAAAPAAAAAPVPAAAPAAGGSGAVVAPLPGTVLSINVKVGDSVNASDTILILEAMKMENAIPAPRAGKVVAINVKQGDSVLEGDTLVTLA